MKFLSKNKIIPLLMCGGSGTRLWPLSRKSYPKQFLKCNIESNNSFLQDTFLRLIEIENIEDPVLICNEEHRFIAAEQMRDINVKPKSIILEPFGRNTAPAIALGTLSAMTFEEDPILLVLPADHFISDREKFIQSIQKGIEFAEKNFIVTFGINPIYPETGFGYIEAKEKLNYKDIKGTKIAKFIEKPDQVSAEKLIQDNRYSWNSGIFLMKANVALRELKILSPNVFDICEKSFKKSSIDLDFLRIDKEIFKKCSSISFDIAIMEKTDLGIVIPLNVNWSDVGTWDSLWKISKKDDFGNAITGNILTENIKNCFLMSEDRLIVANDIEDIIAIETSDAVLISRRDSSQKIKNIVQIMKNKKIKEAIQHKKTFRPWGSYLSIAEGSGWQVKSINVNPGASLSLQKHNFRTEHWIIVSGKALVEIGDEIQTLIKNESTYIPLGCKHRLSNPGQEPLILIEVQSGTYLGEDDIIRLKDNYGR